MKIRLLNVKYSPNLGDGLLVECLEARCRAHLPGADIESVDLAGRTAFGQPWNGRRAAVRVLNHLRPPVRQWLAGAALQATIARRLSAHYREHLDGSDAIIIGGGHLLSDVDLNFPLKLYAALRVAAQNRIPVWVYGCGISEHWSTLGGAIFRSAWRDVHLVEVAVRDGRSKDAWNARLAKATGRTARVVRDPGLLAATVYGTPSTNSRKDHVGLGVIGPEAICYHGGARIGTQILLHWYAELAHRLCSAGKAVTIVSNGSLEDDHFAGRLACFLRSSRLCDAPVALPQHRSPSELVSTIAGLESLVAFRMHALIAASSLGIPTFALAWDAKVLTFMRSIGRDEFYYNVETVPAEEVARAALRVGPDPGPALPSEVRECEREVERLCESITSHCRRAPVVPNSELRL